MHPQYHKSSLQTIDVKQDASQDWGTIEAWFQRFAMLLEVHGIAECDVYNFDETGFRIGQGRNEMVIVKEKRVQHTIASSSRVSVSIAVCGHGWVYCLSNGYSTRQAPYDELV